jgi:hypothetical protein
MHSGPSSRFYVGCYRQCMSSDDVLANDERDSYHMNHNAIHLLFLGNALTYKNFSLP